MKVIESLILNGKVVLSLKSGLKIVVTKSENGYFTVGNGSGLTKIHEHDVHDYFLQIEQSITSHS